MTGIHWLGQCAIPLALLMIGAIIADHISEIHGGRFARVVVMALAVRLLVLPILFMLLAKYLPCSIELKRVIVVEGAMLSLSTGYPKVTAKSFVPPVAPSIVAPFV